MPRPVPSAPKRVAVIGGWSADFIRASGRVPRAKAGHMVCTRPGHRHAEAAPCTAGAVHTWFHVGMRLQHLTQVAGGLSSDGPERAAAKAVIVEEVERLRWRLWNGKAKDAGISIDRIRAVMHHFRGEPGSHGSVAPSRKLWTALRALDGYLVGQSERLVDTASGTGLDCGSARR